MGRLWYRLHLGHLPNHHIRVRKILMSDVHDRLSALVDDDADTADSRADLLDLAVYTARAVHSGIAALQAAATDLPVTSCS
jgi:hypothetical protein